MIIYITLWLLIGLIVPIIAIISELKSGIDLTIKNIIQYSSIVVLGPLPLIMLIFALACELFDIVREAIIKRWKPINDYVVIKSNKSKGGN